MSDPIVTERLTKYYGPKCVVNQVSLRVPAGSVYGFLGRNGAGKSTLIKMLTGLVQPDAGSATLLGDDIADVQPATRARIAYLAEGHPLYRSMSIEQAARFTRQFYTTWRESFLQDILEHFKLSGRQKMVSLSNR